MIVGAYIVFSSVYMVNDQEKAVITTFGQVTGTAEAGMHFKLPFGIQDVHIVEVNAIKRIEIGYSFGRERGRGYHRRQREQDDHGRFQYRQH